MLVILEGLVMCLLLLLVCVIGMANGPVGLVTFFEQDVQERVVALGLTTKARIRRSSIITTIALFAPVLVLVPVMVCFVNGARAFADIFWQSLSILMMMNLFDRLFIDWYWVGHTKAWHIPGTEDLMPYIPRRTLVRKWCGTLIGFPLITALTSWIMTLIL